VNRIKEGLRIKEKASGPWAKVPFFFPPSKQNREGGGRGHGRPAGVPAGGSSRGGGRGQGEKEEGGEGVLPPCSPWAIVHGGGGSTGEQWRGGGARGRRRGGARERGEEVL
jgi:hypothetical protein